jgi:hypothetical protein
MDIVNPIPFELSNFGSNGGTTYNLKDYQFDYALGGIPFLSATRDQWPYTEGMAEIRKQQFDSFAEPGEQSIYGWWLRSQSNFTYGAGVLYQDPDSDNQFNFRFADSLGVDTWTSGQVSLLKQPVQKYTISSSFSRVRGYVDPSGVDAAWYIEGTSLFKVTDAGRTAITSGTVGTPLDFASTGTRYFLLATDGIWSNTDTTAAVKMYSPPAGTLTSGAIEFCKGRIVYAYNNSIYLAAIATTGLPVASPAATYTHTDPNWIWTSITDGPNGIYVAGRNSTMSAIYKIGIDFNGTTEVFQVAQTAIMPTGEYINSIYAYVSTFVGIATNKGFRVGEIDANGDISYGPLLFQPTGGCTGIVGFDRFMYVGSVTAHDGASGLFRVDLGVQVQEQTTRAVRHAYSRDIYAPLQTGAVSQVTIFGATGRLFFSVTNQAVWLQSATDLYATGYLKSGRIRYNTEEPKLYKFISVRTPTMLGGTVQLSVLGQDGSETPYVTFGPSFSPGTGDVSISAPSGPQNWIALRFTFGRGVSDATAGGVLNAWQVKALPGSIRQRLISHTFLLFDEEMDKGGQRVGTDGYTRERFEDFKALARAGDVVTFQELAEGLSTLVIIDDWKYTQLAPPGPGGSTLGGYLTVVLRTVAESI